MLPTHGTAFSETKTIVDAFIELQQAGRGFKGRRDAVKE